MTPTENLFKLDLNNTSRAFGHLTNRELQWAILLFKAFNYPFIVQKGPLLAEKALKLGLPIKGIIKKTIFNHFCGGEDIASSKAKIDHLNKYGVKAILDYSVEGEHTEKAFDETCKEICKTVIESAKNPGIPFAVFKVTGVGDILILQKTSAKQTLTNEEQKAFSGIKNRVHTICKLAYENNVQVMIDAEESWIQDTIDDLALEMSITYNKEKVTVLNTIQAYRHDRLKFMNLCFEHYKDCKLGFKIVRGAYMEKERSRALELGYNDPIQPTKNASDEDYDKAVAMCMENLERCQVVIATHNEKSCRLAAEIMHHKGIDKSDNRVYFSQLLGMSDNISFNMAAEGYNVCKYVPYGPIVSVLPYLGRRAQENSSVKGQSSRELSLLISEKNNRRNKAK